MNADIQFAEEYYANMAERVARYLVPMVAQAIGGAPTKKGQKKEDIPDFIQQGLRKNLINERDDSTPKDVIAIISEYLDMTGKRTDALKGSMEKVNQKFDMVSELDKVVVLSELFMYPKNWVFGCLDARKFMRDKFIYSQNFGMQQKTTSAMEKSMQQYGDREKLYLGSMEKYNKTIEALEKRLELAEAQLNQSPQAMRAYMGQVRAQRLYP